MKKLIILLMAFCLAMPTVMATDLTKKQQKEVEKLAKQKQKQGTH